MNYPVFRTAAICVLFLTFMASKNAAAQTSTSSGGEINTSWGFYNWQVDRAGTTMTLDSEMDFNSGPGLVQIPVTIPSAITVHEVHGNFSLGVFQGGTCGTSAPIIEVRDQNGNNIAAVSPFVFGIASLNLPVKATFGTALPVTSLLLQFYVPQCGAQVVSWSLAMS